MHEIRAFPHLWSQIEKVVWEEEVPLALVDDSSTLEAFLESTLIPRLEKHHRKNRGIVFSPESDSGLLFSLGEGIAVLLDDISLADRFSCQGADWPGIWRERLEQTQGDPTHRILIADSFNTIVEAPFEERIEFVSLISQLAAEPGVSVILMIDRNESDACFGLPGLQDLHESDLPVQLVREPRPIPNQESEMEPRIDVQSGIRRIIPGAGALLATSVAVAALAYMFFTNRNETNLGIVDFPKQESLSPVVSNDRVAPSRTMTVEWAGTTAIAFVPPSPREIVSPPASVQPDAMFQKEIKIQSVPELIATFGEIDVPASIGPVRRNTPPVSVKFVAAGELMDETVPSANEMLAWSGKLSTEKGEIQKLDFPTGLPLPEMEKIPPPVTNPPPVPLTVSDLLKKFNSANDLTVDGLEKAYLTITAELPGRPAAGVSEWLDQVKSGEGAFEQEIASAFLEQDDEASAFEWHYRWARRTLDPEALFRVGSAKMFGVGTPVDYAFAIPYLFRSRQNRNGDATYLYGIAQLYGLGLPKDESLAYGTFNEAIRLGSVLAYREVARMSELGVGTTEDLDAALQFYRSGAEKSDPYCLSRLEQIDQTGEYSFPADREVTGGWGDRKAGPLHPIHEAVNNLASGDFYTRKIEP